MSFRTASDCPCPGSRSPTSASTLLLKGWSRRSAALLCGAGSAAMRYARGNIEAGFSPRDPDFAAKASRVLDLYERVWEDTPLGAHDFVLSADEKTSIQARRRKQPTLPPASTRPLRVEHEYFREGAWTYLAAWDVHRAKVFGRCEVKNGIAPVDRLVGEVMSQAPYNTAHRVFWIMDNCSAHRGQKAADHSRSKWPNAVLVHTPIHASWLNQIEIYFSIVQRKVLTPTTSVRWPNSNSVSLLSRPTTNAARRPSSGLLPAKISRLFWLKSTADLSHLQPNHVLHNTSP